jgi:hypothetical protein
VMPAAELRYDHGQDGEMIAGAPKVGRRALPCVSDLLLYRIDSGQQLNHGSGNHPPGSCDEYRYRDV